MPIDFAAAAATTVSNEVDRRGAFSPLPLKERGLDAFVADGGCLLAAAAPHRLPVVEKLAARRRIARERERRNECGLKERERKRE